MSDHKAVIKEIIKRAKLKAAKAYGRPLTVDDVIERVKQGKDGDVQVRLFSLHGDRLTRIRKTGDYRMFIFENVEGAGINGRQERLQSDLVAYYEDGNGIRAFANYADLDDVEAVFTSFSPANRPDIFVYFSSDKDTEYRVYPDEYRVHPFGITATIEWVNQLEKTVQEEVEIRWVDIVEAYFIPGFTKLPAIGIEFMPAS